MRNQEPLGVRLAEEMAGKMSPMLTSPFELEIVSIMKGTVILKGTYSQ
jgi:hypothetical protein